MRAVTVMAARTVAILAQYAKAVWEAMAYQPQKGAVAAACYLAVLIAATVDVIHDKKLGVILTTALAAWGIATVMLQHGHAVLAATLSGAGPDFLGVVLVIALAVLAYLLFVPRSLPCPVLTPTRIAVRVEFPILLDLAGPMFGASRARLHIPLNSTGCEGTSQHIFEATYEPVED